MNKTATGAGVIIAVALVAYRLFFWGVDIVEVVETEQHNELVTLSNSVVDPLNAATGAVEVMQELLYKASNPADEGQKGAILLLEISGDILPERIAEARASIKTVDIAEEPGVQVLLEAAELVLSKYAAFVPVHEALATRILAGEEDPAMLADDVNAELTALDLVKSAAIETFTHTQSLFLN